MPFGTYDAIMLPQRSNPSIPLHDKYGTDNMQFSFEESNRSKGNNMDIHILVVGRGKNEVSDFMAGLFANANSAVAEKGLALSAEDNRTGNELMDRQRRIAGIFHAPVIQYMLPAQSGNSTLVLLLSRPGRNDFSVRVTFHCTTAMSVGMAVSSCQYVWVLADAPIYETQNDNYAVAAARILSAAKASFVPAYIIMTQFEKYGNLRTGNSVCSMNGSAYGDLCARIKAAFAEGAAYVPIVPVQMYGGLICRGMSSDGSLVFGDNGYTGLNEYHPVGCHIPLLMTIEKLNSGEYIVDNQLISDIKALNLVQQAEYINNGVRIGG